MVGRPEVRAAIICRVCDLSQFRRKDGRCRRCLAILPEGSVESTTIVLVPQAARMPEPVPEPAQMSFGAILPMRVVMQQAAQHALRVTGSVLSASKALAICHSRMKKLLEESGDERDFRVSRIKKGRK